MSVQICNGMRNVSVLCSFLMMSYDGKDVTCALPKTMRPSELTLEQAAEMLKVPEVLGQHPETGMDIMLRWGKFGPYYQHGSLQASAGKLDDQDPTLEVALLKLELKAKRQGVAPALLGSQTCAMFNLCSH